MNKGPVTINVSGLWSESEKAWYFLIKPGETPGAWSVGVWFPKKSCVYLKTNNTLIMPQWLFDAKRLSQWTQPIDQ